MTYTNKLGQVVLKKVQADANTYLETVYIYNETGSLAYQVSPEGVKRIKNGTAVWDTVFIHSWASRYTYDAKNRLVAKKAPGAEPQFMVYDQFDRIVLTQDGRMRTANKWYFTKYDEINRVVLSGLYTDTKSRETLQEERDGDTADTLYEMRAAGTAFGYSNNIFPAVNTEVLLVNYYDDYDFDRNGAEDYQYVDAALSGAPVLNYKNNRGFLTGIKKKVTGGSDWLTDILFYDEYGNVIQKRSNNLLNPGAVEDVTANVYDVFAGHISHTKQIKKNRCFHYGFCYK